ncbi:hypothetical protein ILUMI_11970 [Ignelater luminosus]|uniref:Transposase Tc1-like domain-containing protein n=1 Tax=Ignelater luminosus TaxID=2038154 RepID=A0A8K0CZ50_IGNLU|nr:hypothetical protein ILUMI_11970 [Ignelater luminosus]
MPRRMGQSECSMEIRGRIAALAEAGIVRPGAAYVTNADQDNAIVEMADNSQFISTVRLRETLQLTYSLKTIRHRLHENGIHNRQPAKKIMLTPNHAATHLAFCHANINRDWSNVIYSDEKTFSSSQEVPVQLWRRTGTRYDIENVLPRRTTGRINSGFWG